jgi:hypothetical protein
MAFDTEAMTFFGHSAELHGLEPSRVAASRACALVRSRVEPQTWEAFRLTTSEGQTVDEVGRQLGMSAADVLEAKSIGLQSIRQEPEQPDRNDLAFRAIASLHNQAHRIAIIYGCETRGDAHSQIL